MKPNWIEIDSILNELKNQGYFWEYDNASEHYFSWIADLSHESILLILLRSPICNRFFIGFVLTFLKL